MWLNWFTSTHWLVWFTLLCILLTSVVWIQMGYLFLKNSFWHVLLKYEHFWNLTVEENTAFFEKSPESYVAFKTAILNYYYLPRLLSTFCLISVAQIPIYLSLKWDSSIFHHKLCGCCYPFPSSLMLSFQLLSKFWNHMIYIYLVMSPG